MEGKPSAQSEVLSTLEKVFVQDIPVLHLSLDCNQSSCPCSWKTPPQHDAATTMLHCWDCIGQVMSSAWFSPHIPLRIKAKSSILVSSDQRILQVFLANSMRLSCVLHWGEASVGPLCHKAPTGGAAVMVDFLQTFSHLPNASLELSHSDLGSSLPLSPRLFSPDSSVWPAASSRKGSGRPKRLPFKDYGGHCALRNLKCSRNCFVTLARSVPCHNSVWALQAVPLTSWFSFALTCTVSCKVLYRQVCGFPNQVQSV